VCCVVVNDPQFFVSAVMVRAQVHCPCLATVVVNGRLTFDVQQQYYGTLLLLSRAKHYRRTLQEVVELREKVAEEESIGGQYGRLRKSPNQIRTRVVRGSWRNQV
jgi:hypothetical protein